MSTLLAAALLALLLPAPHARAQARPEVDAAAKRLQA